MFMVMLLIWTRWLPAIESDSSQNIVVFLIYNWLRWYLLVRFYREIAKHLSLPPVKLHCSMLAEDAIKAAVKDYEAKKAKLEAGNAETTQTEKVDGAWHATVIPLDVVGAVLVC